MFTDKVTIQLQAGKGGNGVVAWRREKYLPKGGPTGGNGGRGGSVYLQADAQYSTLDWYRNRRHLRAENGVGGGPNQRQGRRGKDLVLKVPCGTLVKNIETGQLIDDLTEDGEKILLCEGGRGGRGNASFKHSTNQAPNYATPGKPGVALSVELELKLIADVGLVGFPNAGKTTLMTALTRVKPKAAAYPFATLRPNIGYITTRDYKKIFIADIPGIIEGASDNRGLGIEFLRHIERTKLLIFMLDASGIDGRNPSDDFAVLKKEIEAYNPDILRKPILVVLNKIDDNESLKHIENFSEDAIKMSALTGEGLETLVKEVIQTYNQSEGHAADKPYT